MKTKTLLLVILTGVFTFSQAHAERKYLFKWDEGLGTNMPGWTWHDEGNSVITSGHPGWILNEDGPFGGSEIFPWGPSVRTFELGGYGSNNLAEIITSDRAPSTESGGALRIYENPATLTTATHLISWWVWYDGKPISERGVTDSQTDRWSFYIKLKGISGATQDDTGSMFHVGTYLCDHSSGPAYGTGDGCPYEGPGNQHYYHYLVFSPDAWIHVELDQHPQHRRGQHVASDNPSMTTDGFNYMEHLNQWYMEIRYGQSQETEYLLDEMYFYSTQDPTESVESNQNSESVTSLWVGYWPNKDKWMISWYDMSYEDENGENLNDHTLSTFEIRYSTKPITNANWEDATVVEPEWYTYPEATSHVNGVRRVESWSALVYTQFELPDEVEKLDKVYFAIKDVSVAGGNSGTTYPHNRTDGHDAASPYIRAIDYSMRVTTDTTPPAQPTGLSIMTE